MKTIQVDGGTEGKIPANCYAKGKMFAVTRLPHKGGLSCPVLTHVATGRRAFIVDNVRYGQRALKRLITSRRQTRSSERNRQVAGDRLQSVVPRLTLPG